MTAIALTFQINSPAQAAPIDFQTDGNPNGDVLIESSSQVHLSTDGLGDDDSDLGVGNGVFNFSGNSATMVGFGGLETFLGVDISELDLGGFAYEGSAIKTILNKLLCI